MKNTIYDQPQNLIVKGFRALIIFWVAIPSFQNPINAQEAPQFEYVQAFSGTRVVSGHSVETPKAGALEFLISHRFGRINEGAYQLFGLDQATIRLGLEYGLSDWLELGVGRSSLGKHYDGFIKFRLLRQKRGDIRTPISITGFASAALTTLRERNPELEVPLYSKLTFSTQLLLATKIGERFSFQLMPSHLHYNLVDTRNQANDIFFIGSAARIQLSKLWAITGEYYYRLPFFQEDGKTNALGIGFEIKTANHVFQMHFSNSRAMIEKGFIGETTGDWQKADIHFGFNVSRIFKLKGRRF